MARLVPASIVLATLAVGPPALAGSVRQLSNVPVDRFGEYALDDTGDTAIVVTSADPFGVNPAHHYQAVAWTTTGVGSTLTQVGGLGKTVSVSDDGQWLVFVSMADPLGQNAGRAFAGFLQSADGSVLRQLGATSGLGRISGSGNRVVFSSGLVFDVSSATATQISLGSGTKDALSITDDGAVIVYSSNGDPSGANPDRGFEVFRVMADGSNLTQLTSSAGGDANGAMISGNGQRVVYASAGQISVIPASGGPPVVVGPGSHPSITDDGTWVYYSATDDDNLEIYRAWVDGAIPQRLTRTSPPLSNDFPLVSGDGSRVAFVRHGTVEDPAQRVLMRMNSDGSAVEQLGAAETDYRSWAPQITSDGRRVVFLGGSAEQYDVFRIQADGSDLVQVTHGAEALHPSVADGGETIVFQSSLDLTGDNSCATAQIFRIGADGSGLVQLSPSGDCSMRESPVISRDGSTVVYQEGARLYMVPAVGGPPVLVATTWGTESKLPRLSRDGVRVAYRSSTVDAGVHAFFGRTDGSGTAQVSTGLFVWTENPDVSADGSRVAYSQFEGPPQPGFRGTWLYLPETNTSTLLTDVHSATDIRISGDGEYVYHVNPFDAAVETRPRRLRVSTGEVESYYGLPDPRAVPVVDVVDEPSFAVDEVGRVAFSWPLNWTDQNPDLNQEIWFVDFDGIPQWDIEVTTPARVRWTPDPLGLTYDSIRGDVANLGFALDGTVDLGEVVCLADDFATNSTVDPEGPDPGQGFYYVFRATGGAGWGSSSDGAPRVPGTGACP